MIVPKRVAAGKPFSRPSARPREAKRAAEEAMANKSSAEEVAKAEAELSSAIAQLEAIRKLRHRA